MPPENVLTRILCHLIAPSTFISILQVVGVQRTYQVRFGIHLGQIVADFLDSTRVNTSCRELVVERKGKTALQSEAIATLGKRE